jgi:hypothetical protein
MKFTFAKIFLLTLLIISLSGCKKSNVISEKQQILFQYEYVNYAWGYQHKGYIIDNQGRILTYNNPENWNFREKEQNLTETQIADNISKCKDSGIKIPHDELLKYSSYIKNIASSQVTALKNVAADAGTSEYTCYEFSETNKDYKGYLIKMEGDFTCENLNFYSKKITLWLKEIEAKLPAN